MNARTLTTATVLSAFSAVLTAHAADSQLLGLVMPDAQVLAGVNVDSAKSSPFGLWVITQMQSHTTEMQQLIALTGFDPTRDVHELLAASNAAPTSHTGLALARGNFDIAKITAVATAHSALTEAYSGVTIIEDPKQTAGIAFLDSTLVIAGDVASVKGAIDRSHGSPGLTATVQTRVNTWSAKQDAWVLTTVPPYTLHPPAGAPSVPGVGANAQGIFQKIEQASAGVKFGAVVVVTAQAQADNAQDATQISGALQLLVNIAQMQAAQHPEITALVQGLAISATGNMVNITLSLPDAQIQQLVHHGEATGHPSTGARPPIVRKKQ